MASLVDPYRILGVSPGADEAEIKRAYRRLVKRYHPDSAGEGATARFLEIQAAYEALLGAQGPRGRRPSSGRGWTPSGARGAGAWWTARGADGRTTSGRRPGAGRSGTDAPRQEERADGGTRSGGASGGGGASHPSGGAGVGTGRQPRSGRRWRRTATLGSTSYDEALAGPPVGRWDGASWYGVTTGTYWTINPREYADPRKHGPEYEERARRALRRDVRAANEAVPGPVTDGVGREAPSDGPRREAVGTPATPSRRQGRPSALLVPVVVGLTILVLLLASAGAGAAILFVVGAGGLLAVVGLAPRRSPWGGR